MAHLYYGVALLHLAQDAFSLCREAGILEKYHQKLKVMAPSTE